METKLIAAEIATETGITTVITSSKNPQNIFSIIAYHTNTRKGLSHENPPIRPPHTLFKPSMAPIRDLKSWTRYTLSPSGSIVIDSGAHQVLSHRENGGRLLPAGVVDVIGAFASGQAVRVMVRKTRQEAIKDDIVSDNQVHERTSEELYRARENYAAGLETPEASGTTTPTHLSMAETSQITAATSYEDIEVGRGLANYNSQQIAQIKGKKR